MDGSKLKQRVLYLIILAIGIFLGIIIIAIKCKDLAKTIIEKLKYSTKTKGIYPDQSTW